MLANIIVFDVGSTYTKACAFRLDHGRFTFLGRGQSPTTLHDIMEGAGKAEAAIKAQGVEFDELCKRYSSCSAAGGLRMVALGYMPRVTAKAAKEVAMTAGARVMQVVSSEEPLDYRKEVLMEISPDIILLSGGTDGGDETCAMENAEMICPSTAGPPSLWRATSTPRCPWRSSLTATESGMSGCPTSCPPSTTST